MSVIITVLGLPVIPGICKGTENSFCKELARAIEEVPELGYVSSQVSIIFPQAQVATGWGVSDDKIIILVDGMVDLPRITEDALAKYADKLGSAINKSFPKLPVEVFISSKQAYCLIPRKS